MKHTFNLKKLLIIGVAALAFGATPALAGVNADNTLSATASLICSSDPCAVGSLVTASGSVSNLSRSVQKTTLTVSLTGPEGFAGYSSSSPIVLGPGKTVSRSVSALVTADYPAGAYTLTVTIDGASDSSTITIG
jgi:hypothetical protein